MSESPSDARDPGRQAATRLTLARATTGAAIHAERLWPLLLPLLVVLALFASAAWLGVFRLLPETGRLAALSTFGLLALLSLFPLSFFRRPAKGEIDRRIETANGLKHTPVLAQADRLAGRAAEPGGRPADGFADALWREHQKRMAARLGGLGGDGPRARVPERDRWGLRAVAALLFVAAFAFSFGPGGGSLAEAFRMPVAAAPLPPRIDAWVTPPAYTGKAPIFLSDAAGAAPITVPEGSEATLRVSGGSGAESLSFADDAGEHVLPPKDIPAAGQAPSAAAVRQFAGKLDRNGELRLKDGDAVMKRWRFSVTPDTAPLVRFSAEPKRGANGALELAYEVLDDYGAAEAQAGFAPIEAAPESARPLYEAPKMPLTLPRRGAKTPGAKSTRDLTEHVWAGTQVQLTLAAKDGAGQEGSTEPKPIVLPERGFTNPLAKALIEQRRMLGLDANKKGAVLDLMDAVTLRPEDTFVNSSHYLAVMSARTRLELAESDEQLREVVDYLWEVALGIEEGDLSDAEKRLAKAQEALKQALENGAGDEEIDRLMKELREAMNEFLREFAERARENPDMQQAMPPNAQEMRPQDLQRMMDQLENLAKSGNRDAAQELLSQLQQMMENLQAARPNQPGQQGQENDAMREQMDKLGEIMRRQQEMMNETFRRQQGQQGQQGEEGEGQQGQQGQGQQGQPMTPEEFAEALRQLQQGQGQLQRDLQALMEALEGMGMQPGEGFGEAGEAMGQAEGALGQGEGERAVGSQGRALEALRRGAQDMMQQMQEAMQGDQGGSEAGGRQRSSDRDPLGRPRATNGPDLGNSVEVPDEIDVQRARRILEAIRRRLGNALSPELERDYLERLLEMR